MTTSIDNETIIRVATVDYVSFVKLSYYGWTEIVKKFDQSKENYRFPESFFEDIRDRSVLTWFEISTVLFFAVFWNYLRIYLTKSIFLVRVKVLLYLLQYSIEYGTSWFIM